MSMKKFYNLLAACVVLFCGPMFPPNSAFAQGEPVVPADSAEVPAFNRFGLIDINGYYDTRDATTFTINYLAVLSKKLTYFSFINYQQFSFTDMNNDFNDFYSEHMLYYNPLKTIPFDLMVQGVFMGGQRNDKLRFAVNWRAHHTPWLGDILRKYNIKYSAVFHFAQFGYDAPLDDFTWQIEHVYSIQILPKQTGQRIYISGFADQTMGGEIARGVISETQLGVRLVDQLHAVAEYRYFGYFPAEFRHGLGLGLQYLVLFN